MRPPGVAILNVKPAGRQCFFCEKDVRRTVFHNQDLYRLIHDKLLLGSVTIENQKFSMLRTTSANFSKSTGLTT